MPNNSIELFKGDNRMIRVYVKDEHLDVINLNGGQARFIVANSSKSATYIFRKSTAVFIEGIIRTPEKGEVVFFINTADTATLDPSQYYYQIIVILRNGDRYTVTDGTLNLKNNMEYTTQEDPPLIHSLTKDIPANSYHVDIELFANEVIIPVLVSPSGNAEQVWITNLVYGTEVVTVYFSSEIVTEGWKVSYIINKLC